MITTITLKSPSLCDAKCPAPNVCCSKSNLEVGQPGSLLFPGVHILLFRRKDRECLMWIHLRFVGIQVCMCVWVFVHLHMSVCLSERCGLSYALLIVACWLCSALIAV